MLWEEHAVTVTADTSDNDAANVTYQWQFSIDSGANWSNVVGGSGATAATYTTPTLDSTYDEHRYRCILNAPQATQVINWFSNSTGRDSNANSCTTY